MRYFMNVLKLNGSEIVCLKNLVQEHSKEDIISVLDLMVNYAINDAKVMFDSRTIAQFDYSTGNIFVHGNRCKYGNYE